MLLAKQAGISLVEVLVTVMIFMVGALGVGLYTSAGVKTASLNQVRSQAIKAASIAGEPLIYNTRADCMSGVMTNLYPRTVTSDNGRDRYVVSFVNAVDGQGVTVANANTNGSANILVDSSSWSSPITVTLAVPYQGIVSSVVTYPSYTMILQNYSVGCDA